MEKCPYCKLDKPDVEDREVLGAVHHCCSACAKKAAG